jgi:L-cysteine desulfidase
MIMDRSQELAIYQLLEQELVPALGCTEPIAFAYAAAHARVLLGATPKQILIQCSPNLLKNCRCVTVPNTNGLIGIEPAVIAGLVGGNAISNLEVLGSLTSTDLASIDTLLNQQICRIELLDSGLPLHLVVRYELDDSSCEVEIRDTHTNIVRMTKNGEDILDIPSVINASNHPSKGFLSLDLIFDFVSTCDLEPLRDILLQQIRLNGEIAIEGMFHRYGVGIGPLLLSRDSSLEGKMKAYTAAASEARMCGAKLPVVINSGSGNQGLATSVPLIIYASESAIEEARFHRALVLANLLTIHQKNVIGRLSSFCGGISAAASSAAALTYLSGGTRMQIEATLTNALVVTSGIICDGAKASCAAKIAIAVDASLTASRMALARTDYFVNTGLLGASTEETIARIGLLARKGMKGVDEVLAEMLSTVK